MFNKCQGPPLQIGPLLGHWLRTAAQILLHIGAQYLERSSVWGEVKL